VKVWKKRCNNYKHKYTKCQWSKICEAKTDRIEERNRCFTIKVEDFNTSLSIMSKTSRQKRDKAIEDLNNTIHNRLM
jgi:hypothetical protein